MAEAPTGNLDSRGIQRGGCVSCSCDCYDGGSVKIKCKNCGHPPGKHINLTKGPESISPPPNKSPYSSGLRCSSPGCKEEVYFDLNTGVQWGLCQTHSVAMQRTEENSPISRNGASSARASYRPRSGRGRDSTDDGTSASASEASGASMWVKMIANFITSYLVPKHKQSPKDSAAECVEPISHPAANSSRGISDGQSPQHESVSSSIPAPMPVMDDLRLDDLEEEESQTEPTDLDQRCKLPGCTRPRNVEPNGKKHDFCGRRHAKEYFRQQMQSIPQDVRCKTPGCHRPKYKLPSRDGYYDYCSITCRDEHQGKKPAIPLSASVSNLSVSAAGTCNLPGCNSPKYRDPANGRVHDYCGRTHAYQARLEGIPPNPVEITNKLLATPQEVSTVTQKFKKAWAQQKSRCPNIDHIYVITNTKLKQRWLDYQQTLKDKTVEEQYHGTKLTCDITAIQDFCSDQDCGICGIATTGLDRRCVQKNIQFQRFGHGFYLAPNSSKCHDYTQGCRKYRAMLLCDVCPGKKYKLKTNDESLKSPPEGYDSVHGEPGVNLNYDEVVLYNPDAIMPRYIIVYQRDGIKKIAI